MSDEARRLAAAIRRAAARDAERRGPGRYRAVVTSADPLTLEADGLGYDLTADDLTFGTVLAATIERRGGLEVGDVLVLVDVSDPDDEDEDDLVPVELVGASADGPSPSPEPDGPPVAVRRRLIRTWEDVPAAVWQIDTTSPLPPDVALFVRDGDEWDEIEAEWAWSPDPNRIIVRWAGATSGRAYVTEYFPENP